MKQYDNFDQKHAELIAFSAQFNGGDASDAICEFLGSNDAHECIRLLLSGKRRKAHTVARNWISQTDRAQQYWDHEAAVKKETIYG